MKNIIQSLVNTSEGNLWNVNLDNLKRKIIPATHLPSYFIPDPHNYSKHIGKIALHFGDWRCVKSSAVVIGSRRNFLAKFQLLPGSLNIKEESHKSTVSHCSGFQDVVSEHILYTNTSVCQNYEIDKQITYAIEACLNNNWRTLIVPEEIVGFEPTPKYNSPYECVDLIVKSMRNFIRDKDEFPMDKIVFCTKNNSIWKMYNSLIPWHFVKETDSKIKIQNN